MENKTSRITSIDALRAVTLLGILIVHASVMFSFINSINTLEQSLIGKILIFATKQLFQFRCNKIFGILFGVSFYLILRKPSYSPYKFVWRCVLLIGIGLFNKLFYTVDALMWYGIWGIILVLFRKLSCKWLFFCFFCVFLISSISSTEGFFRIAQGYSPLARYNLSTSLQDIVDYPILNAIYDYLVIVSKDPFSCLWQFLIGYYFAKKGIIENIQSYTSIKNILWCGIIYVICFLLYYFHIGGFFFGFVKNCTWLWGAIFYSLLFLYLYYRFYPKLRFLEAYGKLGLTNYSAQGVGGVILCVLVYIPNNWGVEYVILCSILFFVIQLVLSNWWLKYFTNGPLEWAWRCLTNMEYSSPIIRKK